MGPSPAGMAWAALRAPETSEPELRYGMCRAMAEIGTEKKVEESLVRAMEKQISHLELQQVSSQACGAIAVSSFQRDSAASFPAQALGINALTVQLYSH